MHWTKGRGEIAPIYYTLQTIMNPPFTFNMLCRLSWNQNRGCSIVISTDMMTIGMLSKAMKMPSFEVRGPLKPSLSSATRQMDRISRQAAAIAAPAMVTPVSTLPATQTSQRPMYQDLPNMNK